MKRSLGSTILASRPWSRWLVVALAGMLCLGAALSARAQGGQAGGADPDPPDRVARLSEASGKVWLFSPDGSEWIAVDRNRPLTTGDRIATDHGAHAEIALGSTTLRLDSATELEIVVLDDNVFNLHLHSGSVAARLRNALAAAEFSLDTDEGRFRARSAGRYRFDRFEQASDLTVDSGQAVYEGRNSALPLSAGQHAQFWLDAGGAPQYNMLQPARDSFAAWNEERDRAEARPVAATRYVSPEMTGAEDLDRYGQWEQTPEYGAVWTPRAVGVGWAPYSAGHWAYVRPWGWTWVDDAPWGFAPFHYGRWVHYRNRWRWAPGHLRRPAGLCAGAGRLGRRLGCQRLDLDRRRPQRPPVGWFPLAPREVYVPPYRYSPRYVRNINVTHVTNVTQITTIVNNTNGAADRRDFANRKFPHAVTVVPASVLTQPGAGGPRGGAVARRSAGAGPGRRPATGGGDDRRPGGGAARRGRTPSGKVVVTRPPIEGRAPGFVAAPARSAPDAPGATARSAARSGRRNGDRIVPAPARRRRRPPRRAGAGAAAWPRRVRARRCWSADRRACRPRRVGTRAPTAAIAAPAAATRRARRRRMRRREPNAAPQPTSRRRRMRRRSRTSRRRRPLRRRRRCR